MPYLRYHISHRRDCRARSRRGHVGLGQHAPGQWRRGLGGFQVGRWEGAGWTSATGEASWKQWGSWRFRWGLYGDLWRSGPKGTNRQVASPALPCGFWELPGRAATAGPGEGAAQEPGKLGWDTQISPDTHHSKGVQQQKNDTQLGVYHRKMRVIQSTRNKIWFNHSTIGFSQLEIRFNQQQIEWNEKKEGKPRCHKPSPVTITLKWG